MESPAASVSTTHPFTWWPETRKGRIILSILLAWALFFYSTSVEFGGSFKFGVYMTIQIFLGSSAIRYFYLRKRGKSVQTQEQTWWKNPGVGAIAAILIVGMLFHPRTGGGTAIKEKFQVAMNEDKQMLFNWVHPVGTAKSIKVHDVTINNGPDGRKAVVRFTVYWEGPVTKDGFTKISRCLRLRNQSMGSR